MPGATSVNPPPHSTAINTAQRMDSPSRVR